MSQAAKYKNPNCYFIPSLTLFLSFIGGLVCFTLRFSEVDDYQQQMTELEETGIWEKLCHKKIPHFDKPDMPSHLFGFVYRVLKK